ncbi:MAG: hypothetical protein KatS3mg102_0707 [Planctomycetota bacterium]|nr:MAG: hypothetical protein KatS3mg102_0707 [Planctomycetota bacterium]
MILHNDERDRAARSHRPAPGPASVRDEAVAYFGGRTRPFTQQELEALFGVSRFTLLRWRRDGLRCFKKGNVVRYHVEDVYVFLRHSTV